MIKEIPINTNLIINDTVLDTKLVQGGFDGLKSATTKFEILDARQLTQDLESLAIGILSSAPQTTAILFPGNSSRVVQGYFSPQFISETNPLPSYSLPTRRDFQRNVSVNVQVSIPPSLVANINSGDITQAVIIDDVVASGQTVRCIIEAINYQTSQDLEADDRLRFSFPSLRSKIRLWQTFSWLLQSTAKTGESTCQAALTYFRRSGKVAVNSLSTFLSDSEKGQTVRTTYTQKYIKQPEEFISLLKSL